MRNNLEFGGLPEESGLPPSGTAQEAGYQFPPEYAPLPEEFPRNPVTDPDPKLEFPYMPPEHPERAPGSVPEKEKSTLKRLLVAILALTGVSTAAFSIPTNTDSALPKPETETVEKSDGLISNALDALADPVQALNDAAGELGDSQFLDDPYADVWDGKLLVRLSPWTGDGISVCFLEDGTGFWLSEESVGILKWYGTDIGDVLYTGYAALYNVSEDGGSLSMSAEELDDSDQIFTIGERRVEGRVDLDRIVLSAWLSNPLENRTVRYFPSEEDSDADLPEVSDWLALEPAEILEAETWYPTESDDTGVSSILFRKDGTVLLTVGNAEVKAIWREPEDDTKSLWMTIVDSEDSDVLTVHPDVNRTISAYGGLRFIVAYREYGPAVLFWDSFADGLLGYREFLPKSVLENLMHD